MKFIEFKKDLRKKLDILTEEAFQEEIAVYESELTNQNEEERVASFGNLDDIAKSILKKRGIDETKITHSKFVYHQFEELFKTVHRVVDRMAQNELKENVKIVIDLLILIAFICLLKVPFLFVQNVFDDLLLNFNQPILVEIIHFILDISYIILAVVFFMNIFTKWFQNRDEKKANKIKGEALEAISLSNKK